MPYYLFEMRINSRFQRLHWRSLAVPAKEVVVRRRDSGHSFTTTDPFARGVEHFFGPHEDIEEIRAYQADEETRDKIEGLEAIIYRGKRRA